ncbi:MAG: hypothetical protein KDD60_12870, partial [Bdellovibrionales bacterium]|nr:hypothetical protein [Bdellovibrionales bacterium]
FVRGTRMDWNSPFVVYRIEADGSVAAVYQASDMKDAKYWLQYIAEVGDVLTRTPAHPRYDDPSGQPVYWQHKEKSGKAVMNKDEWEEFAKARGWSDTFPSADA